MKVHLLSGFLAAILIACDANYIPDHQEQMVVEGWIDDGGFPVVILTKSLAISQDYQQTNTFADYLIRWAKVTISDGEKDVILTGKYDSRYFPPYIYTTGNMRGEAGKTYSLDIEYRDFHATAQTTIPETHPVKDLTIQPCTQSNTLYQLNIYIDTDKARNSYYQLFTCEGKDNRLFVASYLGNIDGTSLQPNAKIPVYRSHRVTSGKKYTPYFSIHDTLAVKLAHIDTDSYNFWSDYSRNLTLASNFFMAPTHNIRSNIQGAVGYWCGMGADVKYVVVGNENNDSRTTTANY